MILFTDLNIDCVEISKCFYVFSQIEPTHKFKFLHWCPKSNLFGKKKQVFYKIKYGRC